MRGPGFTIFVSTGAYCAIYEGPGISMVTSAGLDDRPEIHVFYLGGGDAGRIWRILGEIATETVLEVEVKEWNPSLG